MMQNLNEPWRFIARLLPALALAIGLAGTASAQDEETVAGAPDRGPGEGEGPFDRLVIRGATLIDGTGAPPRGPVDIVIEGNRIVEVESVGAPHTEIDAEERPEGGTREIDASGAYVLPGFVNNHVHVGGIPKAR